MRFSGSVQEAQQFVDLGFKIGVGGVITYPRANKTRQAIAALPVEHIVLETDAPDMPLNGFQGQANHPAQLAKGFRNTRRAKRCFSTISRANPLAKQSNAVWLV